MAHFIEGFIAGTVTWFALYFAFLWASYRMALSEPELRDGQ